MTSAGQELFCGVDVGASATKVVVVNARGETLARAMDLSGVDYEATSRRLLELALAELGADASHPRRAVATGYGRSNVAVADKTSTEIQCHAVGCYHLLGHAMTVVDIGCQDNKVIRVDADGRRTDFRMNRKCAAGTGAFLEEIALRLGVPLEQMNELAGGAGETVKLSSFCTVFAKTEILAHLRKGEPVSAIVRGAFHSVINRVLEMDPLRGKVVMVGGVVAHNPTIAEILGERLGREVEVPPEPQFTGALGAALIAARRRTGRTKGGK